jgi:hypothetical protein
MSHIHNIVEDKNYNLPLDNFYVIEWTKDRISVYYGSHYKTKKSKKWSFHRCSINRYKQKIWYVSLQYNNKRYTERFLECKLSTDTLKQSIDNLIYKSKINKYVF